MKSFMQGKVCLVTGATRGLGQAAALGLVRMGAEVIIIGRSPARLEHTLALLRSVPGSLPAAGYLADLSARYEVRRVAGEILERSPGIDVLINNVGATLLNYQSSPDGTEMSWSLNYLNHFLITHLLLDVLKSAAARRGEARIIELTSSVYRFLRAGADLIQKQENYNGVLAYSGAKRAVMMFTCEMARRLQGSGVTINAVTPGLVRTDIADGNGWLAGLAMRVLNHFALPVEVGVRPILRLATAPELCGVSGKYFKKLVEMPVDPGCSDPGSTARLWRISEDMLGLPANGRSGQLA